ncbi:unnamed protein product [marine sediment metagenome]|uniref:Uncharacterized protein n=1 Tax=marine sediment metagenome TaxID=412755 RepID=X1MGQ9_9ZZZZ
MFENKSDRELIFIYVIIAIIVALAVAFFNYITGVGIYYNIFAANVIFFCIFYMLYLPLKVRKAREKRERKKQK